MTIPHQISRCSHNIGIRPLVIKRIARYGMAIRMKMMRSRIRRELNKLFHPIKENSGAKHIKSIFPIQRAKNDNLHAPKEHKQGKEMPPNKLGRLLDVSPNGLPSGFNVFHHFLRSLKILLSLSPKKSMNNTFKSNFFKKGSNLWPERHMKPQSCA
jgi:hypothetical protein